MASKAIVLRELRPWLRAGPGPVRQERQRRLGRNDLSNGPGAGLEVRPGIFTFFTPVLGHDRLESTELEIQTRMAGGDQIVVDVPIELTDVAAPTQLCPVCQLLQRLEAKLDLVLILLRFPIVGIMQAEPIVGRAVTALTTDSKITYEDVALRAVVGVHRVATQAELIFLGMSLFHPF